MSSERPVVYASTDEGRSLPVLDVTHPAFAVSALDVEAQTAQFVRDNANRGELPAAVRAMLAQSTLGAALQRSAGTFLDGLSTYFLKLGPDHLGDGFGDVDRRIAASTPALATRVRLDDMARLLADGLAAPLAAGPGRPLRLLNIGGGPAADSWNALLILRREHPATLDRRDVAIAVLDGDDRGPAFGAAAVAALSAAGAPLAGIGITFSHVPYSWSEPDRLAAAAGDVHEAICGVSSEGALFEYGSDEEIVANLARLRDLTAADAVVVGSVTSNSAAMLAAQRASGAATRPRALDDFRALVTAAGWRLSRVLERPFSYNVALCRLV